MKNRNFRKAATAALPWMLAALMGGWIAAPASASVTYTYTGANFNLRNSSYQLDPYVYDPGYTYGSTDHITFSFTLSSALASSASTDLLLTSMTWTASDGKYSFGTTSQVGLFGQDIYDPTHPDSVLGAGFTTDASGNIIGWDFSLFNGAHASQMYARSNPFPIGAQLDWSTVYDYAYSRPGDSGDGSMPIEWGGTSTPGTWTRVTDTPGNSVPEPATLGLMLTGLAVALRRQGRRSPAMP